MSDDKLTVNELKRILRQQDRGRELPGRITADNSISPHIYEQARAAGLIDEDGFETF